MDVHSDANDFQVFRGLSVECPSVIEDCIQQALNPSKQITVEAVVTKRGTIESPIVVTRVTGWWGIGQERIAKYIAKRAMESNLFDCLLWMIVPDNKTVPVLEFQLQVADRLHIPYTREYDTEDDDGLADDVLAELIHAYLSERKFLLVHDADWGVESLTKIGIPNKMSAGKYSMVLVSGTEIRSHILVSIVSDLSKNNLWDLLWEESADISDTFCLRGVKVTPEGVMKCMLYFALIASDNEVKSLPKYWFAEGFIGDDCLDLESAFRYGIALLGEMQRRNIVDLSDPGNFYFRHFVYRKLEKILDPHSGSYGRPAMVFNSTLVKQGNRPKDARICFRLTPDDFPVSGVSPQFTSIRLSSSTSFSDDFLKRMQNVRVLYSVGKEISSLPSFIVSFRKTLKLVQLSNCPSLDNLSVASLRTLEKLELLVLARTDLESMPDNAFEGLQNLRLLDLSECKKLSSLASSISHLLNLEQLLLGGCCRLSALPSSLPLQKLQVLDLSGTKLSKIPEFLVQASKSHLVSLKKLNLSNCSSLEDTNKFSWCFKDMTNLRVLDVSSTNHQFLSLKGCSNLESLNLMSNTNLEALDISATKIKNFPLESNPDLKSLRCLDLLDVKNLLKVNWKNVYRLPPRMNWDQCGDGSIPHMLIQSDEWFRVGKGDGVFMSVGDASIFQSLTPSSPLWTQSLLRFLIYIHPCTEKSSPPSLTSTYKDVYSKLQPHIPLHDRCLEITGIEIYRKGISGVLSHTTFLYLHDVRSLLRLSNLGIENMCDLRECWLKRCQDMEVVFDVEHNNLPESNLILSCLEKMQISELKKLQKVCTSVGNLGNGSFSQLKHLQLEYCPQLVLVFSSGVCLENLEVLEIKHCARLEEIFSGEVHKEGSLQRLQTVLLLELPALNNIVRNVSLLSLKKAKIKGCPKLHKLPIGTETSVSVTGELQWWEQLQWDDNCGKHLVSFTASIPFKLHSSS